MLGVLGLLVVRAVEESGPGKRPSLVRKNRIPHILTRCGHRQR